MPKGILYDSTKCVACRGCQVACKRWNDREAETTALSTGAYEWTNPRDLSSQTWTYIRFVGKGTGEAFAWHFATLRCMHCLDPQCVEVCPVKAITKYDEGPVVIDQSKCIGCRYCVSACPFGVPRIDPTDGKAYKCTMCADRIKEGLEPACVKTCPTGALKFGERQTMLDAARSAKAAIGSGYIYGWDENGGTSVFIVSKLSPTELGYPAVPAERPLLTNLREWLKPLTIAALVAIVGLSAVIAVRSRRPKEAVKEA